MRTGRAGTGGGQHSRIRSGFQPRRGDMCVAAAIRETPLSPGGAAYRPAGAERWGASSALHTSRPAGAAYRIMKFTEEKLELI